ncbi:visual pigment-like receptor peropsin isoform X4 [Amphiura filiformis]|uniref:visual pigment-like receptor peropsin isoform X2 n=1 Tax=Amphiura filiformis TaxID=82378 RepID=UPI003B20E157
MSTLTMDSPLSPGEYFTMGLFLTAEGILGVLCCGVVLMSFLGNNNRMSPSRSSLVISLALADMGIAIICPFAASASFTESWSFGETGCQTYALFGMTFGIASVTNLAALTLDVYRETQGQPAKSNRLLVMAIWVNALFWGVAPLNPIQWGRYTLEPYGTGCLLDFESRDIMDLSYLFVMTVVCFVIPVCAMLYCAVNVKSCMVMTLSLLLYWGVYGIVAVAAGVGSASNVPIRLYALAPVIAKLAPIGNTILVHWTNQQTSTIGKATKEE